MQTTHLTMSKRPGRALGHRREDTSLIVVAGRRLMSKSSRTLASHSSVRPQPGSSHSPVYENTKRSLKTTALLCSSSVCSMAPSSRNHVNSDQRPGIACSRLIRLRMSVTGRPLSAARKPPQVLRVGSFRVSDPPRLEGSCGSPRGIRSGRRFRPVGKRVFTAGLFLPRRRIKQRRIDRHPPLVPKVPRLLNHVLVGIDTRRIKRMEIHAQRRIPDGVVFPADPQGAGRCAARRRCA
jgi:hypothetical protein